MHFHFWPGVLSLHLILRLVAIGASVVAISEASHSASELNPMVADNRDEGIVPEDVISPRLCSANLNPVSSLANEPSALFAVALKIGCPIDGHSYVGRSGFEDIMDSTGFAKLRAQSHARRCSATSDLYALSDTRVWSAIRSKLLNNCLRILNKTSIIDLAQP
ncbi:hypothetical protein EDD22DRAFT_844060 [Suillus occidentalis]|nr:hypothetical protein EDD22DRAFT_844060 [Suillus occidentalis]